MYNDITDIEQGIEDESVPIISEKVMQWMIKTDKPTLPLPEFVKPLIWHSLLLKLDYVTNQYLQTKLQEYGENVQVIGEVEPSTQCPCCGYYTLALDEDAYHDICTVCFWENGGDGPNHMTLKQAQENFQKIGVMDHQFLGAVDPDGTIKYRRGRLDD